jgi:hypothetical protein
MEVVVLEVSKEVKFAFELRKASGRAKPLLDLLLSTPRICIDRLSNITALF